MENIKLYEINPDYIDFLARYEPHLFRNSAPGQKNARKYIGVVMQVDGMDYFAPLSSFKKKHEGMRETIDMMKIGRYAVINLNNMFPVPQGCMHYVNISAEQDVNYRMLLLAEYRIIKSRQERIRKNAEQVYRLKVSGKESGLTKRCNDFSALEQAYMEYGEALGRHDIR